MAFGSEVDAMNGQPPTAPNDYSRLGPLGPLMSNPRVTEVMVMGTRDIYVEVEGKILLTPINFGSDDELMTVIRYIVESVGRRIDNENPLCDARLADGSRVHVAIPPVAVDGPLLNIRKFARGPLEMADLIRLGSGKTTLLNVLSGYIPEDERIVTIEDAAELQLRQRHVARLESRPAASDGKAISMRDLVASSLRMRPDRLIVGEVRGPEALDMLQAMNTGHDGSMTTLHANKPRDALARIETLVMMAGYDLVPRAIRSQIASAFNVVVHLERMRDGSRKVVKISEITGMDDDVIAMQDIFQFTRTGLDPEGRVLGGFAPASIRPRILDRLADRGLETPLELARIFPQATRQPQ